MTKLEKKERTERECYNYNKKIEIIYIKLLIFISVFIYLEDYWQKKIIYIYLLVVSKLAQLTQENFFFQINVLKIFNAINVGAGLEFARSSNTRTKVPAYAVACVSFHIK